MAQQDEVTRTAASTSHFHQERKAADGSRSEKDHDEDTNVGISSYKDGLVPNDTKPIYPYLSMKRRR